MARRHPALLTALGLLVISVVIVRWANTRPGFDPYGWLVWGKQTLNLSLDTNAAPSWKPLPYIFTVPFALFGHYQLWLWMFASCAIALSGVVFAGRIAFRLTDAPPERRWAAWVAAVFAGVCVLLINNYWHYILSSQSDPMIVSLTLAAVDCALSGRRRWAFWCGVLASLGRPEAWPFLGLYGLWLWRSDPSMRVMVGAGVAVLLVLWFGIPAISSRSFFIAGDNANHSGRAIAGNKLTGVIKRFVYINATPVELAALLAAAVGVWRRDRTILALVGIVLIWVIVEIAFAYHGWPSLQRYMFEAGAIVIVLAGVAVGRLLAEPPQLGSPPGFAAVAAVVVFGAVMIPTAVHREQAEHRDVNHQRVRTAAINDLATVLDRFGGRGRFLPCGEPLTRLQYQTTVAWTLHRNVSAIGFKYGPAIHSTRPIVLITPYSTHVGWVIQALHQRVASCRSLPG
ncbi:MAG: hypothetical protein ACYDHH_26170 [Solirubrobacteraceae bacterium]